MPIVNEELLEVITETGASVREIWLKIGLWSENGIRKRLVEMAAEGVITREKQDIPSGFQWVYRLNGVAQ